MTSIFSLQKQKEQLKKLVHHHNYHTWALMLVTTFLLRQLIDEGGEAD